MELDNKKFSSLYDDQHTRITGMIRGIVKVMNEYYTTMGILDNP